MTKEEIAYKYFVKRYQLSTKTIVEEGKVKTYYIVKWETQFNNIETPISKDEYDVLLKELEENTLIS